MHYAIIAAGEGSRLQQEGVAWPKPLVRINGVPMIKRLIDMMMQFNPESLSVIVNEQMTEVREYLQGLRLPVPLHLKVKSTPSSMHSFYEVAELIPAGARKFVLTTVDTIFRQDDFARYVNGFEQDVPAGGYMGVTTYIDDEKPLYVDVDRDMRITAYRDHPFEGMKYISGGIYGLTPEAIDILRRCMADGVSRMRNYQRALIAAGYPLRACDFSKVIDVDHASDIAVAEEMTRN